MTAPRRLPAFAENALLLASGAAMVLVSLIPLSPGGGVGLPDLLYGLVIAWTIRRPATTPLWIVLTLGIFADLMLSRPPGLGALGLLLAFEWFRLNAARFHGAPFVLEWLSATAGFAAILVGMRLALLLVFADAPSTEGLIRYLLATALAYPFIVVGLNWGLQLQAPASERLRTPFGRVR